MNDVSKRQTVDCSSPQLSVEFEVDFPLSSFIEFALGHGHDMQDFALFDFHVNRLRDVGSLQEGGRVQARRRRTVLLFEREEISCHL